MSDATTDDDARAAMIARIDAAARQIADALPFDVELEADMGGTFALQIDLGSRTAFDDPHDTVDMDPDHEPHVWMFGTDGGERIIESPYGLDADPADVAAWITRQANEANSAAIDIPKTTSAQIEADAAERADDAERNWNDDPDPRIPPKEVEAESINGVDRVTLSLTADELDTLRSGLELAAEVAQYHRSIGWEALHLDQDNEDLDYVRDLDRRAAETRTLAARAMNVPVPAGNTTTQVAFTRQEATLLREELAAAASIAVEGAMGEFRSEPGGQRARAASALLDGHVATARTERVAAAAEAPYTGPIITPAGVYGAGPELSF